ncbi:MAG: hypothetical protein AAGJ87_08620, partial [Pseudomonadota bacterium]
DGASVLRQFDRGSGGLDAVPVITADFDETTGQYIFDDSSLSSEILGSDGFDTFLDASLWRAQFGIRFEF